MPVTLATSVRLRAAALTFAGARRARVDQDPRRLKARTLLARVLVPRTAR